MELQVTIERHELAGVFRISRSSRTETRVVVATLRLGDAVGRGECGPNTRYGETPEAVAFQLESLDLAGITPDAAGRSRLLQRLPAGAARNALDCALWDLEAKLTGRTVAELAGIAPPARFRTAMTLSINTPQAMAEAARKLGPDQLLKVKLDGEQVLERVGAVTDALPGVRLIVDANEAWSLELLGRCHEALAMQGVVAIEQPLPAGADAALAGFRSIVPLIADESCHVSADVPRLAERYAGVNIKLDKTGGLTEALALRNAASDAGMHVMVGCMLGTSLAMAPASHLVEGTFLIDLDAPFLLRVDRQPSMMVEAGVLDPPKPALWG
ncbi:MAG TPA: N-acetyl-D-Glu racemase DgcA [Geminicoccus sp.]|uniref:N-acetyl-D-Glu racemase DgcA n=1 Tax=Geminicoccus sp. TaxID=2024832 RepID=UPI002D0DBF26|nr:N-acetyl-D-Glu racemase DgcA [Geminicoccus sp.]HWL67088.1 N-acetyl-D-Glu racemase DgcA [Geminicoccus sp.]